MSNVYYFDSRRWVEQGILNLNSIMSRWRVGSEIHKIELWYDEWSSEIHKIELRLYLIISRWLVTTIRRELVSMWARLEIESCLYFPWDIVLYHHSINTFDELIYDHTWTHIWRPYLTYDHTWTFLPYLWTHIWRPTHFLWPYISHEKTNSFLHQSK